MKANLVIDDGAVWEGEDGSNIFGHATTRSCNYAIRVAASKSDNSFDIT
jgi:hypothetical protein